MALIALLKGRFNTACPLDGGGGGVPLPPLPPEGCEGGVDDLEGVLVCCVSPEGCEGCGCFFPLKGESAWLPPGTLVLFALNEAASLGVLPFRNCSNSEADIFDSLSAILSSTITINSLNVFIVLFLFS